MNELMHIATSALAAFLSAKLPALSAEWWTKHVFERLTFQQRIVHERGQTTIKELDFAALLRVLDQNWYELSSHLNLPREGRTWVKELQTVRNKWAHLATTAIPLSDIYRDADTLGRLLTMIGAPKSSIEAVEASKSNAIGAMATGKGTHVTPPSTNPQTLNEPRPASAGSQPKPRSLFQVGDLVALRSTPTTILPVLSDSGGGECRYRVFENNAKATYYESQLQRAAAAGDERGHRCDARELHARLTSLQILSPSTANLFSLRSGRVQFVPYQYRPVSETDPLRPARLLIADEVGVGKTIEAGLISKNCGRMDIASVLVICPEGPGRRKQVVSTR